MDTVAISPLDLHARLGSSDAPLVIDVRRAAAFEEDDRMLAGAVRWREGELVELAAAHALGRPVIAYCVHGREVSGAAARALAAAGLDAALLEGGIERWRELGLPTVRRRPEWRVPGGSRWITRERPRIDRVACPWLIRRFVDPLASFDFAPANEVLREAAARGAIAFDLPGAPVGHRGERCSFDAVLEEFDLHDAALDRLASVVRGADTNRPELAPECAGLATLSEGLARRFASDSRMLEAAMPIYDALYAGCRGAGEARAQGAR